MSLFLILAAVGLFSQGVISQEEEYSKVDCETSTKPDYLSTTNNKNYSNTLNDVCMREKSPDDTLAKFCEDKKYGYENMETRCEFLKNNTETKKAFDELCKAPEKDLIKGGHASPLPNGSATDVGVKQGTTLTVACDSGHLKLGSSRIRCGYDFVNKKAIWKPNTPRTDWPKCVKQKTTAGGGSTTLPSSSSSTAPDKCPDPPKIDNAEVTRITNCLACVTCNEGFINRGADAMIECRKSWGGKYEWPAQVHLPYCEKSSNRGYNYWSNIYHKLFN